MPVIDIIAYIVMLSLWCLLGVYVVLLRRNIRHLHSQIITLSLDKTILLEKLAESLNALEQKPLEQTDGFLKFMTESRDYAFSFIETMQTSIQEFEDSTKDIFAKSEMSDDVKKILDAYGKLKQKTLPADIPNN